MRILSIAFALATVGDGAVGGAEQILAHIDRHLVAAGHESIVVAANNSQVCGTLIGTPPGPVLVDKDYYSFRYSEHWRQIKEALASGPIDLIHMHGFDFYEFIPKGDIPLLATLHLPPQWYVNWIYYNQRPNFFLNCVSQCQRLAVKESRLVVRTIPNGVQVPELHPLPPNQRKGAVMLGRICPDKGVHLGIAAAHRAGIPLAIAGRTFGYPEHLHYFENQIQPALNGSVRYLGPVAGKEKIELLASSKCLLVPSVAPETSSLVSMEALACGTPVIAMRSGALPEIIEHGKTGFIVDSVENMADAIAHIDEIDPITCWKTALRSFSVTRMAEEYIELYKHLIGSERSIPIPIGDGIGKPYRRAA